MGKLKIDTKNKSDKKLMKLIAGTLGCIGVASAVSAMSLYKIVKKKLDASDSQHNMMYIFEFGSGAIETNEDTENVFIGSAFADIKLDMTKKPITHDITVDLTVFCSRVKLVVPESIRLDMQVGAGVHEPFIPEGEGPVIHVVGSEKGSMLVLKKK